MEEPISEIMHAYRCLRRLVIVITTMLAILISALILASHAKSSSQVSKIMPPTLRDTLSTEDDIQVTDSTETPTVTLDQAKTDADGAGFIVNASTVGYLVRFTNSWYGSLSSDADNATVTPFYSNALVWVLSTPNMTIPLFGDPNGGTYTATINTMVDATTGQVIEAVTTP